MATKQRGKHSNKVELEKEKKNSRPSNKPERAKVSVNKIARKGAKSGKGGGSNAAGETQKRTIHGGKSRSGSRSNEKK
jgi:hypothetical protein